MHNNAWLLTEILSDAAHQGASDIHIQSEFPVFFNVDSGLIATNHRPTRPEIEQMISAIMKNDGAASQLYDRREKDLSFLLASKNGETTRFRVNISLCKTGIYIVMRRLKKVNPNPFGIGVPKRLVDIVTSVPYGIVFIVGPTGSGKSTTLASIISWMADEHPRNIITIEDPVEYDLIPGKSNVVQREVHKDTESFGAGLRAAMRQRPNIIMVGEVRDPDTAVAALQAAKSGHLVFTTMHTSIVTQIPGRIASMFPADQQPWIMNELMDSMVAGVAQTLVKTVDGGRKLVTELIDTTSESVREMMREGQIQNVRDLMRSNELGWTMNSQLMGLIKAKQILPESAKTNTNDLAELKYLLSEHNKARTPDTTVISIN